MKCLNRSVKCGSSSVHRHDVIRALSELEGIDSATDSLALADSLAPMSPIPSGMLGGTMNLGGGALQGERSFQRSSTSIKRKKKKVCEASPVVLASSYLETTKMRRKRTVPLCNIMQSLCNFSWTLHRLSLPLS